MIQLPMKKWGKKEVTDWNKVSEGSIYVVDTEVVEVVKNEIVTKVSKNGKARKERRITSRIVGHTEELESGSDSFKLGRFIKKLKQLTYKKAKEAKKVVKKVVKKAKEAFKYNGTLLPSKQDDIMIVDFFGIMEQHFIDRMAEEYGKAENMKEIKAVYRKWAKKTHPDKGVYAHKEAFELVKGSYEIFAEIRRIAVDTCREAGVEMEY